MSERVERRLTAILAADVVGYSRLMGADEEGTLAALKAIRRELVDPRIVEHRGRIVKTAGDGLLVEFASVVDAVRCAVDVQREMAERNTGVPTETRIEFRVGINLGDIIIDGDDIFGDGVNVAARLETLAKPGGICVSRVVRDQVRDKLAFAFEDMGEQQVKNIARPVRVFAVNVGARASRPQSPLPTPPPLAREGSAPARVGAAEPAPLTLPDKPSLAVLPFQNMSGDPEQEYFADGMVEEITTAIARLPWLFVIARNSAFTYKGRAVDVKQVAQELGVRYVLEGSVRKGGNRVRITGQLIDTATGAHIWVDRFDGSLDDIFELQDQIASSVVGAIEPRLRQSEIERTSRKPTANLDAYDFYLRALAQFHRYTDEGFAETVALLEQALAIDPSYAPAAALVGACRIFQGVQGWGALSDADISAAVRLARQALEAGRDDAETVAHAAFTLFYFPGETAMAMAALDRALALNPNAATAWVVRGAIHALRNQSEPAIEACDRALRLSPFDPLGFWFSVVPAIAHLLAGRFEQAIEWADRSLHDQPRYNPARRCKIVANAHLGRLDEARAELGRMLAIDPGATIARYRASVARSAAPEYIDVVAAGLRLAGLPEG
jgi:TolB-like protein/class 3 adenylate cyclase